MSTLLEQVQDRILTLSDEDLQKILDIFKYDKRIEILPDLIQGDRYYYYDNNIGKYEQVF